MPKQYIKHALSAYYGYLCRFRKPYEYIHVLSHPRSGSTLLSHLLVNHPDITGFGESKLIYADQDDLKRLPVQVALKLRRFPTLGNERYVFDKLVHNWLITADNVATIYDKDACVIFLLREPKATLDSMRRLNWIRKKNNPDRFVIDWYVERINTLKLYCQQLSSSGCQRLVVLTFEQILNQTKIAFSLLESALQLKQPLSENYSVYRTTGKWGHGDSSEFIQSGRIVRNRKKETQSSINIDGDLEMVNQVYLDCYRELTRNCASIR